MGYFDIKEHENKLKEVIEKINNKFGETLDLSYHINENGEVEFYDRNIKKEIKKLIINKVKKAIELDDLIEDIYQKHISRYEKLSYRNAIKALVNGRQVFYKISNGDLKKAKLKSANDNGLKICSLNGQSLVCEETFEYYSKPVKKEKIIIIKNEKEEVLSTIFIYDNNEIEINNEIGIHSNFEVMTEEQFESEMSRKKLKKDFANLVE